MSFVAMQLGPDNKAGVPEAPMLYLVGLYLVDQAEQALAGRADPPGAGARGCVQQARRWLRRGWNAFRDAPRTSEG